MGLVECYDASGLVEIWEEDRLMERGGGCIVYG